MNPSIIIIAVIAMVIPFQTLSQSHSLLKDINPGEGYSFIQDFLNIVKWNDKVYFIAHVDDEEALYVTDGTSANTYSIFKIRVGNNNPLVGLKDHLLIVGSLNDHHGLIRSDGTAAGTEFYFAANDIDYLLPVNDSAAVIVQNHLETHHYYGWTDGYVGEINLSDDIVINTAKMVASRFGNAWVVGGFTYEDTVFCGAFISDGTSNGTRCLEDFFAELLPGAIPSYITGAVGDGSNLFVETYSHGHFVYDGTSVVPVDLHETIHHYNMKGAWALDGQSLIQFFGPLYRYDHLTKSTSIVTYDLHDFAKPVVYDSKLYFHNADGYIGVTNGTSAGTVTLNTHRIEGPAIANPYLFIHNDKLYYTVYVDDLILRCYDLVTGQDSFFAVISHDDQLMEPYMIPMGEKLLYMKRTEALGTEWWVYDPMSVSTKAAEAKVMLCYPNPVNQVLRLQIDAVDFRAASVVIYTLEGKMVKQINLESGLPELNVSDLVPGPYQLEIRNNDNEIFTTAFVKQ
jgi:hypothetical protein